MPSSPVQAFAQPLLTMMARATPPERVMCSRETSTGAACALLIVNMAAAVAGVSETSTARSSGAVPSGLGRLIPAAMPAARNP